MSRPPPCPQSTSNPNRFWGFAEPPSDQSTDRFACVNPGGGGGAAPCYGLLLIANRQCFMDPPDNRREHAIKAAGPISNLSRSVFGGERSSPYRGFRSTPASPVGGPARPWLRRACVGRPTFEPGPCRPAHLVNAMVGHSYSSSAPIRIRPPISFAFSSATTASTHVSGSIARDAARTSARVSRREAP
jgi:hypothetical protein